MDFGAKSEIAILNSKSVIKLTSFLLCLADPAANNNTRITKFLNLFLRLEMIELEPFYMNVTKLTEKLLSEPPTIKF